MKQAAILLSAILLFTVSSAAVAKDIYGPKTIDVEGKREKIIEDFKSKDGTEATLVIINGIDGPRATSLKLVLNGKRLAARKQVNSGVRSYSSGITLKDTNSLKMIVKGKGASVLVRIVAGQRDLLDRVVAVGDSISAGMQDNTLVEDRQVWSFPAQLTDAASVEFILPLIGEPGMPARQLDLVNGNLVFLDAQPPGQRLNPEEQPHDLAVPGAAVEDVLNTKNPADEPQYKAILGGNMTMIEHAERLEPTLVLLWIGSNNILGMILNTDPAQHTDLAVFRADFETMLKRITATGAKVVAANLVDITSVAYLLAPPDGLGWSANDRITLVDWLAFLQGQKTTFTDDEVLTAAELDAIRATVDSFNAVIKELCDDYNVPLIDAKSLFDELHANGLQVAGTTLTTTFLEGIFSLDAVHPSNTTHGVIANEFIKKINSKFGADIQPVNLEEVYLADPLQQHAEALRKGVASGDPVALEALKRIVERNQMLLRKR